MKLKSVQINNFRCFDSLSIDLDQQLTVLVAKNGQGKSAVLDTIRIGLWPFVSGFDLAHTSFNDPANAIGIDDVRMLRIKHDSTIIRRDQTARYDGMVRQLPCEIALEGDLGLELSGYESFMKVRTWKRFRQSEAPRTKTRNDRYAELINFLASSAQDQVRNPDSSDIDLPVFGYYGTGRLWNQKKLTKAKIVKGKHSTDFYMRLFGYRDCLDPSSSYKHFADWFTWIFECYMEDKFKLSENFRLSESSLSGKSLLPKTDSVWSNIIQVVQQVTNSILLETGWHTLEYSVSNEKSLVLKHEEYGTLKVEQLSDGIRNVLGMVGDIAYRCLKLNPHLGLNAAKEARGVVMIDEVDMHLHPSWQQTILGGLTKAFPKIQFIVTTHSPQVISTVPSHQIRILDGNQVYLAGEGTQGAEASRVLKEVFGVELRAQHLEIVQKLNRYLSLVDEDKWDTEEAKELRQSLDEWSHGHEPELVKADIDIRMKEYQRQL